MILSGLHRVPLSCVTLHILYIALHTIVWSWISLLCVTIRCCNYLGWLCTVCHEVHLGTIRFATVHVAPAADPICRGFDAVLHVVVRRVPTTGVSDATAQIGQHFRSTYVLGPRNNNIVRDSTSQGSLYIHYPTHTQCTTHTNQTPHLAPTAI